MFTNNKVWCVKGHAGYVPWKSNQGASVSKFIIISQQLQRETKLDAHDIGTGDGDDATVSNHCSPMINIACACDT